VSPEGGFWQLAVRRSYPVPRDLVFRALTDAEWLERWFCPSPDVTVQVTQLDLRVGGRYRFVFRFPGDRTGIVVGEYRTLVPPRRLAFTWAWEPPDPHAGSETLVTINLYEKKGGTELALTHTSFTNEPLMRQHEGGWAATLDRLKELIEQMSKETGAFIRN
jgi:uncharacterized protein YndB with AHSA1/START domain